MNPGKVSKKLWARITESRWTIAYISFAVLQMVISVSIEAIILKKNEESHATLKRYIMYDSYPKPIYKHYTYTNYTAQFQSIKHGNIWFMVFEAFLVALCLSALFFQNTIEIISVAFINSCLIFLAGVQVFQSNKWIKRVNQATEIDSGALGFKLGDLDDSVVIWEIIQLLISIGFICASILFGYKLYKQFGWNIYKKIGANIQTQRMYRTYLVFLLLLKLELFLLFCFQSLNLVFLFNDSEEEQTRNIIFQSIMVASVIPMVGVALWGVRRENIVAMFLFAVTSVITIGNFLYILAEFIIKKDEYLLTLLDVLGILLSIMSMVVAYLAVRNFGNGLKQQFQREHEGAINLEPSGQGQRKRFSIDD